MAMAMAADAAMPLPPVEVLFAALAVGSEDPKAAQAQLEAFFASHGIDGQLTGPLDLSFGALAQSIGVSDPAIGIRDIEIGFDANSQVQSTTFGGTQSIEANPNSTGNTDDTGGTDDTEDTDLTHEDEDGDFFHITLVDDDFRQVFHFDRQTGEGFVHDDENGGELVAVPRDLLDQLLMAADGVEGAIVDVSDLQDGYFPGDGGFPDLDTETTAFEPYAIN